MIFALLASALAAPSADLRWNLSVGGQPIGTREVKVKIFPGDEGTRRILESWTQIDGRLGPINVAYRQRLTAHAEGAQPASFHSVIDNNGEATEIQGRWTPSGWSVNTNVDGRVRSADYGIGRVDLSTADLFDPLSRVGLEGRSSARVLSAITGDVLDGAVTSLGSRDLKIGGRSVAVEGWTWASPEGKSDFYYSGEGYLVKFRMVLLGVEVEGVLDQVPPGGIDDFPVSVGRPTVEILPL